MSAAPAAAFLQSLTDDLVARSAADLRLVPFAELLGAIDCSSPRYDRAEPFSHPSLRFLSPALDASEAAPGRVASLREVAGALRWYQIYNGGGIDPALAEGMLAAQVAGPAGMVASDGVRCGLFLLAPGIYYPRHTHAAAEIYYGLSGELELAYGLDRGSFLLQPGGLSLSEPHRLHSLTTHETPVLLIYIWTGPVDEPTWWWDRRADGPWTRSKWVRAPDASWQRSSSEAVTDEIMRQALGA